MITPPIGIRMMGYTVQECVSESIDRELTATALVLSDGSAKVVIIACDLLFIQSPHVDRIRERVGAAVGVAKKGKVQSKGRRRKGKRKAKSLVSRTQELV